MKIIITIDTEADNQWEPGNTLETKNIAYLPRFQSLCEQYGFKPTYLCTFEAIHSREFDATMGTFLGRGKAEVGAHLHPWSNPPYELLCSGKSGGRAYPSELSARAFADKVTVLTEAIERKTAVRPGSYRAGRWGFCAEHIPILEALGYRADCSVTPLISWASHPGKDLPGPDFRGAPAKPYFLNHADVRMAGDSSLLEVPVTIVLTSALARIPAVSRLLARIANKPYARALGRLLRVLRGPQWFRPWPHSSARDMIRVYRASERAALPVVEMMLNSSELTAGASPFYPTGASVEKLYAKLERVFRYVADAGAEGTTLRALAEDHMASTRPHILKTAHELPLRRAA